MDVWLAKSEKPTPVLVFIHGGGFLRGDKRVNPRELEACLKKGISVAAITYRFSSEAMAPASFLDGARAIQFLRYKAKEWNLDAKRISATGGSAGGGISLWLAFHDDLADPKSGDPVSRQSTRLSSAVVINAQCSYDPRFTRELLPGSNTYQHPALASLFGIDIEKLDKLPADKYKLMEEVSPINHLTQDDPPVMLIYNRGLDADANIHHAKFGKVLKDKMDKMGIPCVLIAAGKAVGNGERQSTIEFITRYWRD
ncbi:MAG: hypothetical protein KatS3mg105_2791 [Gemmatales bacterium]|nr:MAG: hypothetical protein KatS3mg105_2791 [Gemmatales bacterium]